MKLEIISFPNSIGVRKAPSGRSIILKPCFFVKTLKHKKHNGKWSKSIKREIFSGSHVATVLPYDPKKKKIVLINQFRAGVINQNINPIITEIVAGIISKNEKPVEAAIRECEEETGCRVKNIKKMS